MINLLFTSMIRNSQKQSKTVKNSQKQSKTVKNDQKQSKNNKNHPKNEILMINLLFPSLIYI